MKVFFTPPNWLRWVLFLPASLLFGAIVWRALYPLVFYLKSDRFYNSEAPSYWIAAIGSGALSQYFFSWAAQIIAPRGKILILRAVSGAVIPIYILLIIVGVDAAWPERDQMVAHLFGGLFGALYAWTTIRTETP